MPSTADDIGGADALYWHAECAFMEGMGLGGGILSTPRIMIEISR